MIENIQLSLDDAQENKKFKFLRGSVGVYKFKGLENQFTKMFDFKMFDFSSYLKSTVYAEYMP